MSNALERAAKELAAELDAHDIKVYEHQRRIHWRGLDKYLNYGTTKAVCRRTLKKFISAAKATEMKERQGKLL